MLNGEVKNMPCENIWDCLNRPLLSFYERDVKFIMIHNIKPIRERLFRLNQCRSGSVPKLMGLRMSCTYLQVVCAHKMYGAGPRLCTSCQIFRSIFQTLSSSTWPMIQLKTMRYICLLPSSVVSKATPMHTVIL